MGRLLCFLILTASPVQMNAARVHATAAMEALVASEGMRQVMNDTNDVKNQTTAHTRRMEQKRACRSGSAGCSGANNDGTTVCEYSEEDGDAPAVMGKCQKNDKDEFQCCTD
mmetsp:Transcript_48807/g.77065  ORF Transcript_48807/g.77065 Transcript_48807/m.77065 type:complete len:112 (-) Transcript_48807:40-375(-)